MNIYASACKIIFIIFFQEPGVIDFQNVPLDEEKETGKKKKIPRRILHFSDGILEEYSTDEEDEEPPPPPPVDPVYHFAPTLNYM